MVNRMNAIAISRTTWSKNVVVCLFFLFAFATDFAFFFCVGFNAFGGGATGFEGVGVVALGGVIAVESLNVTFSLNGPPFVWGSPLATGGAGFPLRLGLEPLFDAWRPASESVRFGVGMMSEAGALRRFCYGQANISRLPMKLGRNGGDGEVWGGVSLPSSQ